MAYGLRVKYLSLSSTQLERGKQANICDNASNARANETGHTSEKTAGREGSWLSPKKTIGGMMNASGVKKGEWVCALLVAVGFVVLFLGIILQTPLVFVAGSFLLIFSGILGVFGDDWDLFPSDPLFKP
jgi:hypothetical protein